MHYKRPVLVPHQIARYMDTLGKGDLIDLCWSLAGRLAASADDPDAVLAVLADESDIVAGHRGKGSPSVRKGANYIERKDAEYRASGAFRR